ncbi:hypothetical protein VRR38_004723 [Salmonella enterica]|nr:hypothetical protein [Klebsiella pneumoniae]ELE4368161.1 hypothetical protein [Salmonella enterica]EMD7130170.1 hypothetical protein [Salmonella enterica]
MPIDKKEVENKNRTASKTKFAVLRTDRSILLVGLFLLGILNLWAVYRSGEAVESAKNTREVVWVKLLADGRSEVTSFKPEDEQPVFIRTVNSGLAHYIESRYQVHPETVKRDYAEAGVFMGGDLFADFTSKEGFNAAQKAADIAAKPGNITRKDISDVQFDHYDQIDGDFSGTKKPVIRTTITWKETEYRADGAPKPSVSRMQRITWTLLDRKEISQKSDGWLRLNPLGIEILTKNEMDR